MNEVRAGRWILPGSIPFWQFARKSPVGMNIGYYLKTIGKTEELNSISEILNIALETWFKTL